jgi:copper(I)-binding protein
MKEGTTVPVTLVVESKDRKRSTVEVKAAVKPLTSSGKTETMDHSRH